MKKFVRLICLVLACSTLFAIPAQAASTADSRASAFFSSYGTDLYITSDTSFQVWFDVTAKAGSDMQILGVSEIIVYRSADQQSWTKMRTYSASSYTNLLAANTGCHGGCVTYNYATPGYYYTAFITFYAQNSTGIGERDVYTEIIKM